LGGRVFFDCGEGWPIGVLHLREIVWKRPTKEKGVDLSSEGGPSGDNGRGMRGTIEGGKVFSAEGKKEHEVLEGREDFVRKRSSCIGRRVKELGLGTL